MAATDRVFLSDRVKEISYSVGTGHFKLEGAAKGFGTFGDFYNYDDAIFYAITDGTDWEVGSGQYFQNGSDNAIKRFPFNSSNSNSKVNFNAGVKEVFVTYPGKFAVYTANGIDEFQSPRSSGIAFWGSQQTLDYDPQLIWDTGTDRLGVGYSHPSYQIDVFGKNAAWSLIRSSGTIVGESGVMFSGVAPAYAAAYSGGIQLEPFMRNEVDNTTGSDAIFSLSGLVDQRFLLRKQPEGTIWAGPPSGDCAGPCEDDYPVFRYLIQEDIPDLSELYARQHNDSVEGSIAFYYQSGVYQFDPFLTWDKTNNRLGVNKDTDLSHTLNVDGSTSLGGVVDVLNSVSIHNGDLSVSGNVTVSGNLDVQGNVTYIDSATVTVLDPQLQLGSLSGTAVYTDFEIDEGGIVLQSTEGNKEWIWKDTLDSWDTKQDIRTSGNLIASGDFTLGSSVDIRENVTVTGTTVASGWVRFYDELKASGDVIFGNSLRVTTDFETSGTLNASGNAIFDGNVNAQKHFFASGDTYFIGALTSSGALNVSGDARFDQSISVSGDSLFEQKLTVDGLFRCNSGIVGERLTTYGDNSLNYINGSTFFRTTTSDPFAVRINGLGVTAYSPGAAYCGTLGAPWSRSAANKVNAVSGLYTGQSFIYSTYASDPVDPIDPFHWQRLSISGARYGNFEITTEALGSGQMRALDFQCDTIFTSGVSNSGHVTMNGGLDTYSGGLSVLPGASNGAGNVVINSSGLLTIPIFESATDLISTLPVAEWTSGAIMFIHDVPNKAMAFCDGYAWSSGDFKTV